MSINEVVCIKKNIKEDKYLPKLENKSNIRSKLDFKSNFELLFILSLF